MAAGGWGNWLASNICSSSRYGDRYNQVLRFFTGAPSYTAEELQGKGAEGLPFLQKLCETLLLGTWTLREDGVLVWTWANKYTTTIHAINSCIIKLSKLTKARKVYRGLSGATMPAGFYRKNEYGVAGGIEFGFGSFTPDRNVALGYRQLLAHAT